MGDTLRVCDLPIAHTEGLDLTTEEDATVVTITEVHAAPAEDTDEAEEEAAEWNPGYHFESPERALIRKEMLREQLGKLTDRQREVFLLYHQCGYTQQEIAEMLGITQKAVDFRLDAAERKVRLSTIQF